MGRVARPSSPRAPLSEPSPRCLLPDPPRGACGVKARLGGHGLRQQLLAGSVSLGCPSTRAPVPSLTNPAEPPQPPMSPREPRSPRPSALAGPPEGPPASHYPNTPAFTWQTLFIFSRKNRKTNVPSGLERTHGQHGEHMRAINTCVRSSPRPSRSPRSGVWTRPRCPHALCGSRGHSEPDPPTQGSQAVLQGGLRR